jgi:hypothetical protein
MNSSMPMTFGSRSGNYIALPLCSYHCGNYDPKWCNDNSYISLASGSGNAIGSGTIGSGGTTGGGDARASITMPITEHQC